MCVPKHQKKSKSASRALTLNSQQQELWHRRYNSLSPESQETILSETRAAQSAGGSRLAMAIHLLVVRRLLSGDATNPKQKKLWSAYLAVFLPGLCISRSQLFKDMAAAEAAQKSYPPAFLRAFLSSGYALRVRPTVEEPLGKYTKPCTQILAKLKSEEPNERQYAEVLASATAIIKAQAKKERPIKTALTADEKRKSILASLHNTAVSFFSDLAKAIESGDSYSAMHVRDDLEEIVCRLMTALGVGALELRQMPLPEGFDRLSLPGSNQEARKDATRSDGSLARRAAADLRVLHSRKTVASDTFPATAVMASEVPDVA